MNDFDNVFTPKIKKRILVAVLFQITIGNMMVQNLSAFLPNFNRNNKWSVVDGQNTALTTNDLAYITSAFSLAQVIFSPLSSSIKNYLGAKNTIVLGLTIVSLSTALLGFLGNVEDGNRFLSYALLFRFI